MRWNPKEANRLWRYNLHYFDYLGESTRSLEEKCLLLDDWVANNPPGSEPAWEPYTASLRIVNWCRFLSPLPIDCVKPAWLASLYQQARWLEANLELHILANHYFENIKALLFAGSFFNDKNAARWLKKFQRELIEQLHEQTLADGGHYERSPQYHCILLEDYLDLFVLVAKNPELFTLQTYNELSTAIRAALGVLIALQTPDDDIPLFNDSASGAAARPSEIILRAKQLGLDPTQTEPKPVEIIDLPDTGLYGSKTKQDYFLIDCGAIGPNYQPGHTHCDFLSYVLMADNQWLVVDSGVSEYEPGEMRRYVRSTAAHNTVIVNGQEQSEVWGEFRVGRRATRIQATMQRSAQGIDFHGSYRGFPSINGGITHRRRAMIKITDNRIVQLDIADDLEGDGLFSTQSLVHFHPALHVTIDRNVANIFLNAQLIAQVAAIDTATLRLEQGWYCPEFGLKQPNSVLVIECAGTRSLKISYTIRLCNRLTNIAQATT